MRRRKSAQRNLFRSAAFDNSHRGSEARLKRSLARKRGSSAAAAAEAQNNFNFEKLPQVLLALWCTRENASSIPFLIRFFLLSKKERGRNSATERERERTARALILPSSLSFSSPRQNHRSRTRGEEKKVSFHLFLTSSSSSLLWIRYIKLQTT